MKKIIGRRSCFEFGSIENKHGSIAIEKKDGRCCYTFDIFTPVLYRMNDDRDNKVLLYLDDKWEYFTPSLRSSLENADMELDLIENNNKRTHYKLKISVEGNIPFQIDAKAEGMSLI